MTVKRLLKSPAEVLKADAGAAIAVAEIASEPRGLVAAVAPLAGAGEVSDGVARLTFSDGDDGEIYFVTAELTRADGSIRRAEYEVSVVDGDFTMPDGGPAMLDIAGFVAKFGLEETIRLTDAGDGRIDRPMLVEALTDAQAMAEANLADRYDLPFLVVPPLVKAIVADLAHVRLYTNEPPDNVARAAQTAERNLTRLARGEITLGPAATESAATADPVMVAPGALAYPDRLRGYR